jgi:hypothetical protein
LVNEYGYDPSAAMLQTVVVLTSTMCLEVIYGLLGLKYNPFSILKTKLYLLIGLLPIVTALFVFAKSPLTLFFIQITINGLGQGLTPATPIINRSFPVVGRYTYLLFIWAISHSIAYLLTGYVCEAITNFHVLCGLLFLTALVSLAGVYLFNPEKLIKNSEADHSPLTDSFPIGSPYEHDPNVVLFEKQKNRLLKSWMKKNIN